MCEYDWWVVNSDTTMYMYLFMAVGVEAVCLQRDILDGNRVYTFLVHMQSRQDTSCPKRFRQKDMPYGYTPGVKLAILS